MTAEPQAMEAAEQQQDDLAQQEELIDILRRVDSKLDKQNHDDVMVLAAALGLYDHFK